MENTKVITIDCDEVLCNTAEYMMKYTDFFTKRWIKKHTTIMLDDLSEMYHFIHENLEALQENDKEIIQNMLPVEWAQEAVQKMVKQWYKLYIITWRTDNMKDFTYQRLNFHFPNAFKEVFFCNNYKNKAIAKSSLCEKVGSQLMIDDDPRFVDDIKDITVVIFDRPRNREYNNKKRMSSWNEILQLEVFEK